MPDPTPIHVRDLRTEQQIDPIGIDVVRPRLSWRLDSDARGATQTAYQIQVAESEGELRDGGAALVDTGRIASTESLGHRYPGPPPASRARRVWRVRVWDQDGRPTEWSAPARFEMGLLSPADWRAEWIGPDIEEDRDSSNPAPLLRTEFDVVGPVSRARVYATAHGVYELHVNGRRVGDDLLTPGWTTYQTRLQYQTYDIGDALVEGRNAVGMILGDGWYRGRMWPLGDRNLFGDRLAGLVQIEIERPDGSRETIVSDGGWRAATGPILVSDLYDGEVYDARLERPGWTAPGHDDADWAGVDVLPSDGVRLIAPVGPAVRRMATRGPERIFATPDGTTAVDFGQNMVGWVRLRVRGSSGTTVTLRHGEILGPDGNVYTDNLRSARQTVTYTLRGGEEEVFEPHFTVQGFRYVSIDGYPGALEPDDVTGIVVHTGMPRIGTVETSDALLSRLHRNIEWTARGNYVEVPTDCPQRAERMGWTGDGQAFSATGMFAFDTGPFFAKWFGDVAVEQAADGAIASIAPDVLMNAPGARERRRRAGESSRDYFEGTPGWGDAITIIPWNLYLAYGDTGILADRYDTMRRWVDFEERKAGADRLWTDPATFGDWLDLVEKEGPVAELDDSGGTDRDVIGTAFFARSTDLLRRVAGVLGRADDEARYSALFDEIRAAFAAAFVAPDGRVSTGTQGAQVLALDFDLIPEHLRAPAAEVLVADVRSRGHLTTGILTTRGLLPVLTRFGHVGDAYALATRTEYPSWLYAVRRGATTVWERWDGIRPDGSLPNPLRNSFNHYALAAVGEWINTTVAGINPDPAAPGYRHSIIRPIPGGGLTWVDAALDTRYGRLASAWRLDGDDFTLDVRIPPNTTATVHIAGARLPDVSESDRSLADATGVTDSRQDGDSVVLDVTAGRYRFRHAGSRTT